MALRLLHWQSHLQSPPFARLTIPTVGLLLRMDPQRPESSRSDKYSFSSYQHPSEIPPPGNVAGMERTRVPPPQGATADEVEEGPSQLVQNRTDRIMRRKGYLSGVKDWYDNINRSPDTEPTSAITSEDPPSPSDRRNARPKHLGREPSMYSVNSLGSDMVEPTEDSRSKSNESCPAEDVDDLEKNTLRQMDYKTRRKHLTRTKIEYNVTCKS